MLVKVSLALLVKVLSHQIHLAMGESPVATGMVLRWVTAPLPWLVAESLNVQSDWCYLWQ